MPKLPDDFLLRHGLIRSDDSAYKKAFTTVPTGVFNVDRFRKSRNNYWEIIQKDTALQEKKQLIITDWAYQFAIDKPPFDHLETLLAQGFDVYVWTGKLTKIKNKRELS